MKVDSAVPSKAQSLHRSQAGFSVFEMLLSMLITTAMLVGALNMFDVMGNVGRVQTQLAGMQQAARVGQYELVQMARLTGRGGLAPGTRRPPLVPAPNPPLLELPDGIALALRNNVTANDREVAPGYADSPKAAEGTDILVVRGVLSSPIYQVNPTDAGGFTLNGDPPTDGVITVRGTTPTGIPADLEPLKDQITVRNALLLVSPLGEYAVVEIEPAGSNVTGTGKNAVATINFKVTGGTYTSDYARLNKEGTFPDTLISVSAVGVLDEYRFYIRDDADLNTLSRARVFPRTNVPYADEESNLSEDIAENIIDLQVALGLDKDASGDIGNDEWLFDDAADDPDAAEWDNALLLGARINTLARTERPERGHTSRALTTIEDRDYSEPDPPTTFAEAEPRLFRRRLSQTIVDLRNL